MKSFIIEPQANWFTNPKTNSRKRGVFLSKSITAFYHGDYHGGNTEKRETIGTVENIITTLKNQFQDKSIEVLAQAVSNLKQILQNDLPQILQKTKKNSLTICVIPRAKAEITYSSEQLLFKQTVATISNLLNGFYDGTDYIVRHTNTRTTHLDRSGYGGDGDLPYPNITKETCTISNSVKGKDILLIDDLYTETINIDEDAIQALLDNGARSVFFYAIGKTMPKQIKYIDHDESE
jgi:predicted amidophosphoribosyltransferase